MPKKKVVYAGLLHDSYTDENGKEFKSKVIDVKTVFN